MINNEAGPIREPASQTLAMPEDANDDIFGGNHCEQDGYTRFFGDGRHSELALHQSG